MKNGRSTKRLFLVELKQHYLSKPNPLKTMTNTATRKSKKTQIEVNIDIASPDQALLDCVEMLEAESPAFRKTVAAIVRGCGFGASVRERHVVILRDNLTLGIVTSQTGADWN